MRTFLNHYLCIAAIAAPWLMPFTPGPTPSFAPWLFSVACTCLLLAASRGLLAGTVAVGWLAAALASVFVGLVQYFGWAADFAPWVNRVQDGQVYANLRQRNQFATLTGIGMAALLWHAWSRPGGRTGAGWWLWWLAAVLLGLGNALSASRTGLLQLHLLGVLLYLWRTPLRSRASALYGAAMAAYWLVVLATSVTGSSPSVLQRAYDGGPACASRLTLWSNVLDLIALRPVLGWGWGELDYAHYANLYAGPRFCDILDNAHNLPLHLAVELGVPLAATLCLLGLALAWRARPWRETDPARRLAWAVLGLIGVHSLLEYPLWYGPFQMAAGLSLWMLLPHRRTAARPGTTSLWWKAALLGPVLAACAYAAWDYRRISQIYRPPEDRATAYRSDTLEKIRDSRLFGNQVRFAELTTTELTLQNAEQLHAMALALLHFSPEPRVIEKAIESAVLLGRLDEARFHAVRYRAAFAAEYVRWAARTAPGTL